MIKLYFLRHGQTEWNLVGKYQGTKDVALSKEGILQAKAAACWFDDIPIDAIYTSPLQRAYMTAEILGKRKGISPISCNYFAEICFGDWEGMTYEEIEAKWPGSIAMLYDRPDIWEIPHAERFSEVQNRVMKGIYEILASDSAKVEKNIVIVSHGAAIRMMLCGLLELPIRYSWRLSQGNTGISCVHHYSEGENWLYLLNSMEHLKTSKEKQDKILSEGKTI